MLYEYIKKDKNSKSRESILRFKFLFDMKAAAAQKYYDLKVYNADVDNEGSDVVLDDGENMRKLQLKSIGTDSKTKHFKIHAQLLRPTLAVHQILRFDDNGKFNLGAEGAVVLQVFSVVAGEIKVSYEFFDLFLLYALKWNLVAMKNPIGKNTVSALLKEIQECKDKRVRIPRSLFIKAKTPPCLLALTALRNAVHSPGLSPRFDIPDLARVRNSDRSDESVSHEKTYAERIQKFYLTLATNLKSS